MKASPTSAGCSLACFFVEEAHLEKVRYVLHECRRQEDYFGEIHFSGLPGSFGGAGGPKARTARAWLKAYESGLCDQAFFSALAIDRASPKYDHKRFTKDFHAYNRFTAMALKAGISWHLGTENLDEVYITFVSDAKNRATCPDQKWRDNFEEYLPSRAEFDSFLSQIEGKKYPSITLDVRLEQSEQEDLLQFCDLLLGATQMALVAGSNRKVKIDLGRMVQRWCEDLKQPHWNQRYGLYRKFNLWAFPDEDGRPYNNPSLQLRDDTQLALF